MTKEEQYDLPGKTVERLSQYRRILYSKSEDGKANIYSHELAKIMNLTPVQVRRDLMLIGYAGSQSKGYVIKDLINLVSEIIDAEGGTKMAVVGMGNLGRAIANYLHGKREKLSIVASFDNDLNKTDRIITGVPCHHENKIEEIVKKENITIAIITVAPEATQQVANKLLDAGVKGILNFTSVPLTVPEGIYLEEYDIITTLEKLAYMAKY